MVFLWTREFSTVFEHTFSFMVFLPYSRFTLTHHVQPIIEELDFHVEAEIAPIAMVVEVYDPPPSKEYVHLVEAEL